MDQRLKKILVVSFVLMLGAFIALMIINSRFRITKIEPGTNPFPNSIGTMEIYFNKKLDTESLKKRIYNDQDSVVYASFGGNNKVTVEEKRLIITFESTPDEGKHVVELKNITTTSGDTITKNIDFTTEAVEYERLSKRGKEIYDEEASFGEEQPIQYPILKDLPYSTGAYLISYRPITEDNDGSALVLVITVKAFKPGNIADPATPQQTAEYLNKLRSGRNEALSWLKTKGYKLDDYSITYTEPELVNEFPAGIKQP